MAITSNWEAFVDKRDLPPGVPFKDPSKYSADESHAILSLWRGRQRKGEIPFQFLAVPGPNKTQDDPVYAEGIFDQLKMPSINPPAHLPSNMLTISPVGTDESVSEGEQTHNLPRVAWNDVDSGADSDSDNVVAHTQKAREGQKAARKRRNTMLSEDEDLSELSPVHPELRSSPTLVQSSPARKDPLLPTPAQSVTSTPTPEPDVPTPPPVDTLYRHALRTRTKEVQATGSIAPAGRPRPVPRPKGRAAVTEPNTEDDIGIGRALRSRGTVAEPTPIRGKTSKKRGH